MENKEKRIYAIAVVDSQYLRDYKLKRLEGDESLPEYDKLLKVYGNVGSIVNVRPYKCSLLQKPVRRKIGSCTRWKTMAGCTNAMNRIDANPAAKRNIMRKLGDVQYQLQVVDITECWNDTVMSEILQENLQHESRIKRLEKKLLP